MPDSNPGFQELRRCENALRESLDHHAGSAGNSNCDKRGLGFNLDDRFSAAKVTLSLDSWLGYYGKSSCSKSIRVGDDEVFRSALIEVLNRQIQGLLSQVADLVGQKAKSLVHEEIQATERKLAELRKIKGEDDAH